MHKDDIQTIKRLLQQLDPEQLAEIRRLVDRLLQPTSPPSTGDGRPDPLEKVIGTCRGPDDLADAHDRYLYDNP